MGLSLATSLSRADEFASVLILALLGDSYITMLFLFRYEFPYV